MDMAMRGPAVRSGLKYGLINGIVSLAITANNIVTAISPAWRSLGHLRGLTALIALIVLPILIYSTLTPVFAGRETAMRTGTVSGRHRGWRGHERGVHPRGLAWLDNPKHRRAPHDQPPDTQRSRRRGAGCSVARHVGVHLDEHRRGLLRVARGAWGPAGTPRLSARAPWC